MRNSVSLAWFIIKLTVFLVLALSSREVAVIAYQQF